MFAALNAKEREMVQRGVIAKGMSQDAVMLSWGYPSMRYEGFHNGHDSMRWDYTGARPVYSTQFYGGYGYGYGYGYHGRYGYPYYGAGFAPEVAFVPYHRASVWFVNRRVDSWESLR